MGKAPKRSKKWRRLGLRGRVTAVFGVGALLVSSGLALITYTTARHYFIKDRTETDLNQTFVNAAYVRSALQDPHVNIPEVLDSLDTIPVSLSVLYAKNQWYETDITLDENALPPTFRKMVRAGAPSVLRFQLNGVPELGVGVPIRQVGAAYYEVFSLEELDSNLHTLAGALLAAAALTTVLGAIIGRWASGRALRPLRQMADTAISIAEGHLDARIDESRQSSDLAGLVASFNFMADNLQSRIEREARFTADVNHELRSPLTTLVTTIDVLDTHQSELPERYRPAVDLLKAEVTRFRRMVTDLLEISRFDAGNAELSLDEVQVEELVRNALGPTNPVPVHVTAAAQGLRVRVDKRRIERVIGNLVENATTYGGGATDLTVDAEGAHVRLSVEDSGPGVPQEDRERVFERFSRGSTGAGQRLNGDGAGLGLALVAEHVRLHGGTVWVDDSSTGGARFVVQLPLKAGE